ncbi:SAM-dependent methyltransferase [Beijerinckia mobilis]|uniref:SAM-dependent methyltransferase n=1 Tax=Beijerinckia mobilis TaxID=231434 RepID=UPI000552B8BE|nr:SAM-dependent methyltransferase [Beijerinckia mobilis]
MDATIRAGEKSVDPPVGCDARLVYIGVLRTPWVERGDCPRQGDEQGPECRIELDPRWLEALTGIEAWPRLQVLYWMHEARRDLVLQWPHGAAAPSGTFALRSPVRPNPIASSIVTLVRREPSGLIVRGLDCLDGTPLLDLKPHWG